MFRKFFRKEPAVERPKRARARVTIDRIHDVALRLPAESTRAYAISNISSVGVAFAREAGGAPPPVGASLQAELTVDGTAYPVTLRIVHRSDVLVGCAMAEADPAFALGFERYFRNELAALSLRRIEPAMLKHDADGQPCWFHGPEECELYYVQREGRVVKFRVTLHGELVEGRKDGRLLYGQVWEDPGHERVGHRGSLLVRPARSFPSSVLEDAVRFVSAIDGLDPGHRGQVCARLTSG